MMFSELDILIIRDEILSELLNGEIREVRCEKRDLFFEFKGRAKRLFVSLMHPHIRVHLTDTMGGEPHSFTPLLKGYRLRGAKIRRGDRVLYLLFEKKLSHGLMSRPVLAIELTGKYSNVILVDQDGIITDFFQEVPPGRSRFRKVVRDEKYVPPPEKPRSLFRLDEMDDTELRTYLGKFFPYLSCGENLRNLVSDYVKRALEEKKPLVYLEDGRPLYYAPLPSPCLEGKERAEFETLSEAIEYYFRETSPRKEREDRVLKALLREREWLREFPRFREYGELILRHINEIEGGASSVELEGKVIPLDPRLSPGENADRYFSLYKRMKRGLEKIERKIRERSETGKQGEKPKEAQGDKESTPPYHVFTSPGGLRVYVGKNRKSNEMVTFELGARDDIFFHVKGGKGAHVILKTEGREPGEDDILFAARLALLHSNLSADGKGLVSYTPRKYVRRVPGQPGTVTLEREEVIQVRLDE